MLNSSKLDEPVGAGAQRTHRYVRSSAPPPLSEIISQSRSQPHDKGGQPCKLRFIKAKNELGGLQLRRMTTISPHVVFERSGMKPPFGAISASQAHFWLARTGISLVLFELHAVCCADAIVSRRISG